MPPIFDYECSKCKERAEVYRTLSESELVPQPNELRDKSDCPHEWKKLILSAPAKSYGPGWGNKKGYY